MMEVLDIRELIKTLASIEQAAVGFYQSLAKHTKNEKVRILAKTMARVEKEHQTRYENLYRSFKNQKKAKPPDEVADSVRQYVLSLIDCRIFHSPEHAEKIAEKLTDPNEAVDMAIRFEKENLLLLIECRAIVQGEARKVIEKFMRQEKDHIISLQKIRKELEKI